MQTFLKAFSSLASCVSCRCTVHQFTNSWHFSAPVSNSVHHTNIISAYFLHFGLESARGTLDFNEENNYNICSNSINKNFYFLLVPATTFAWSVLFLPDYSDVPLMAFHGTLAYTIYWAVAEYVGNSAAANFIAAMATTSSAGITSYFTGRQALGDSITGLYALLPGAYLVNGLFEAAKDNVIDSSLLGNIIVMSVTIGLGGWTGTLLFAPTILGTNRFKLKKSEKTGSRERKGLSLTESEHQARAMLFF